MDPGFLVPPDVSWVRLFVFVCFTLYLGCMFHAIKVGIHEHAESRRRGDPRLAQWTAAGTQVAFLVVFAFAYWFLESMAHTWTPYFVYSPVFPDGIPLWQFDTASLPDWFLPDSRACPEAVREMARADSVFNEIPLSVILMESSLTYAAMWTALMLKAGYRLVPVWAALFVVTLDGLLDPVVGVGYDCSGQLLGQGGGLGFWHWFVPVGPDRDIADWFGVPLFNYAAWWTAPVILVSLAMFVQYFRGRFWRERRNRRSPGVLKIVETAPESPLFGLTAAVLLALWVLIQITKVRTGIWLQWTMMAGAVLVTAALVFSRIRSFCTECDPDPNLTLPPLVLLAFPALALVAEGLFLRTTGLALVALVSTTFVVAFTLWPYQETVCRFCQRLIDLDRFIRLAYYGFSSILVLLGAFAVALERSLDETGRIQMSLAIQNKQILGLLAVALAFQVFAYVSNDVIDLDIDREQPKRKCDPLVRGAISPQTALAIAIAQVPAALLLAFLMEASPLAYAVLIVGFALMTFYNVFGKWCENPSGGRRRFLARSAPLITDAAQALSWGLLSVFGALIVDPGMSSDNWMVVGTVFAFGFGFILLINGIHGGLRDLKNDLAHGCETTARWMGARVEDGVVLSTGKIRAYAYAVHAAMFVVMPAWVLATARGVGEAGSGLELQSWERWAIGAILAACLLGSHMLLRRVVREREPQRDTYIGGQALVLMQTPLLAFVPLLLGMDALFIVAVCFYGPVLATRRVVCATVGFTHPGVASRVEEPPS